MSPLLIGLLAFSASLEPSFRHEYQGRLIDRQEQAVKRFRLECTTAPSGVYWCLGELGGGSWPWSVRFGKIASPQDVGPALLFESGDVSGVVELASPAYAAPRPLAAGAAWDDDQYSHAVSDGKRVWRVTRSSRYGMKQVLDVDKRQPLVTALREDIVLGRGERFVLQMDKISSRRLSADELQSDCEQVEQLIELRSSLGRPLRVRENNWSRQQLQTLRENGLPAAAAHSEVLVALLQEARKDVDRQDDRVGALQAMTNAAIGKAPAFALPAATGAAKQLSSKTLGPRVVVLHFWSYRSKPLKDPYGQAGYLDFLWRKLPQDKTQIIGVAVPGKGVSPAAAAREARKFGEFMNLSYPLAVDDGPLLKSLGDPRQADGQLPLFVVLSGGKVVHYHAGNYEVDRQRGLRELQEVVNRALQGEKPK